MTVKELRYLVDNLDEYIHVPGGIERLKKTILHLAVSGQLVPQDPSEGTGEELYQQIQVEKAKLIAEGKIKKQKPLPEITEDEIPFKIPKSWKWVKLGNASIYAQRGKSPKYTEKSDFPVISQRCVRTNEIDWGVLKFITSESVDKYEDFRFLQEGDLLLNSTGTGTMGRVGIYYKDYYTKVVADSHVTVVRFSKQVSAEFAHICFNAPFIQEDVESKASGSTNQIEWNLLSIQNESIPLPASTEQKRIVEKVNAIFALINELAEKYAAEQAEREKLVASSLAQLSQGNGELALAHLAEIIRTKSDAIKLRQTILHLAVSGQLVPQDPSEGVGEELYRQIQAEKAKLIASGKLKKQNPLPEITESEIPFEIPKSWKWVRLGDVSEIFNGNSINASEKKLKYEKITDGYPYLGTKDVGYGFDSIDYNNGVKIPYEESKFIVIKSGTVLICSEGGSAGKKCGIIDRDVAFGNKMYAFDSYGHLIQPQYVLYNYLTKSFYEQFQSKMTGIIGGISVANFKELVIPLPPFTEQTRIIQNATQLLGLISELEKCYAEN